MLFPTWGTFKCPSNRWGNFSTISSNISFFILTMLCSMDYLPHEATPMDLKDANLLSETATNLKDT